MKLNIIRMIERKKTKINLIRKEVAKKLLEDKLIKEWHPTKNEGIDPNKVTPGSGKKVWWNCAKGHEWESQIYNRTKGNGCPYCSGKKLCYANSLAKINPGLAKEWHPTKNKGKTPVDVMPGSNKKVWWRCKKGHEWETTPNNRKSGNGCPYCSGRKATLKTSLALIFPELAKEWNINKNKDLIPEKLLPKSNKKVWWICSKGHEWESTISNRVIRGDGCPYCSGHKLSEENCLAIVSPELLMEWHQTKNKEFSPYNISYGSLEIVWWKCKKGHEWEAGINSRTKGAGCPYCSGHRVSDKNSLAVIRPDLVKEWHPTKNKWLKPENVSFSSSKKVWWRCEKEHEWEAEIQNRNNGNGCPYCAGKLACEDNCLANLFPIIAKEWNYVKNINTTPYDVTYGSSKKYWWKCNKEHEWEARISERTKGCGCPYCSNHKVCEDNCLATVKPELIKEWHPTKNQHLTPYDVLPGSNRKVWWECQNGHQWTAQIASRTRGNNCPKCFNKTSFAEQILFFYMNKTFKYVENRKQIKIGKKKIEADIFIPELNLVIEYDGFYFHKKSFEKDKKKVTALQENNFGIINMREKGLEKINDLEITVENGENNLESSINELVILINKLFGINKKININIERDRIDILNSYIFITKQNSVAFLFPQIAKEWNYARNGDLSPDNFSKGSHQSVWWICENGHEWKAPISRRTNGSGCRYCSKKKKPINNSNDTKTIG